MLLELRFHFHLFSTIKDSMLEEDTNSLLDSFKLTLHSMLVIYSQVDQLPNNTKNILHLVEIALSYHQLSAILDTPQLLLSLSTSLPTGLLVNTMSPNTDVEVSLL